MSGDGAPEGVTAPVSQRERAQASPGDGNPSDKAQGVTDNPRSATRARSALIATSSANANVATSEERATRASYVLPPVQRDEAGDVMATLAEGYTAVTGCRKVTPGMRRLLLVCYRRHGPDTASLLRHLYAEMGTTVDLLGRLRDHPPRAAQPVAPEPPVLRIVEPMPAPPSAEQGDLDDFLDSSSYVNPPCLLHPVREWVQRSDASYYCGRCHPPSVSVGIEVDPTGRRHRASA